MQEIEPGFKLTKINGEPEKIIYHDEEILTLQKPSQIKDSNSGRCLLVASGPSIKALNLKIYDPEPVFFMNGSILKLTHRRHSPTYFVADDSHFVRNSLDIMAIALEISDHLFLSALAINILCRESTELIRGKKITLIERVNRFHDIEPLNDKEFAKTNYDDPELNFTKTSFFRKKNPQIGFSKNLSKGYFSARTIPYCTMQIGYHMGFRDFHIAGMDLTSSTQPTRFYNENKPLATTLNDDYDDRILPSFKLARELAKEEGWVITNLSKQSRLPSSIIQKL